MAQKQDELSYRTDYDNTQNILNNLICKRIHYKPNIERNLYRSLKLCLNNLDAEFETEFQTPTIFDLEKAIVVKEFNILKNKELRNKLRKQIALMRVISMKAKCPISAIVDDI